MSVSGGTGGYSRIPTGQQFNVASQSASTSATLGNGNYRAAPVYLPFPITLTQLGVEVTGVGDAGCTLTPAVHADDGTGQPGTLVGAGAAVAGDAVGVNLGAAAFTVPAGWTWWGAILLGVTVTQPTVRAITTAPGGSPLGGISRGNTGPSSVFVQRSGLAAVPSPFGAVAYGGVAPAIVGRT